MTKHEKHKHAELQNNRPAMAGRHPVATVDLVFNDQLLCPPNSNRRWPEKRQRRLEALSTTR